MLHVKFQMEIAILIVCLLGLADFSPTETSAEEANPKLVLNSGVKDPCKTHGIWQLFTLKEQLQSKLRDSALKVTKEKNKSKKLSAHQLRVIQIFQKELNETEVLFYESLASLKKLLKGDYKSLRELKETSRERLEELKRATLEEEEEYKEILGAEKAELNNAMFIDRKEHSNTPIRHFIGSILNDISVAADRLEQSLEDGSFERNIHSKSKKYHIETVIRVKEKNSDDSSADSSEGVVTLIDSHNNQFVLSKPKDGTITHVDHSLITDIICVFIFSFAFGGLCSWFNLPNMFAMIATGILLGPAGLNVLKSIVQIETLGEFGVFFILFTLGLGFSPEKLKLVWKPSLLGTVIIAVFLNILGIFWGTVFGITTQQGIFLASCMVFSSTAVMTKLLHVYDQGKDHLNGHVTGDDYKSLLVGMLVTQDIILGIFMGVLPILAGHFDVLEDGIFKVPNQGVMHHFMHGNEREVSGNIVIVLWMIFEFFFAVIGLIALSFFVSKHIIGRLFWMLNYLDSGESVTLGVFTLMFSMLTITDHLGISMELGCFMCGVIVGSQGDQLVKQVTLIVEPVNTFFSCLFFVSIGLHVFPAFVLSEIAIMVPITCLIVGTKFTISAGVLHYLHPGDSSTKWVVSAGLAQLSEFSFVLGSRGRRFGLISREVYLTILSVTTLSLLLAPLSWKLTLRFVNGQGIRKELRKLFSICKRPGTSL